VLGTVIALLVVLLVVLVGIFVRLLQPVGVPAGSEETPGLEWVRSMYGFGPSAQEQLLSPSSVAIAPNGEIYATDPIRARIMVFRPDGVFSRLLQTGKGGAGEGQFIRPESISIDGNGDVYIADSWAKKIIVFDAAGKYLREWPVDQMARGVYAADGKVYVLDVGHVIVFDSKGEELANFGTRGREPGQIDAYQGIVAKDGVIYVADSFNKRIQAFTETGTVIWSVPSGTRRGSVMTTSSAQGDGSGSKAVPGHAWDLPQDLVFDARGRLIVVDAFRFEIAVVDPKTGKVQATYGEYGREDGQFYYPTSIAYDPARDWFAVADTQNNRVQIVRIPGSGAVVTAPVWSALSSPYRYLAIPAVVLVLALAFAVWMAVRLKDASMPSEQAEEELEDE
jgi:DNA-binding beta-propeller fold protein YncE